MVINFAHLDVQNFILFAQIIMQTLNQTLSNDQTIQSPNHSIIVASIQTIT